MTVSMAKHTFLEVLLYDQQLIVTAVQRKTNETIVFILSPSELFAILESQNLEICSAVQKRRSTDFKAIVKCSIG